MIFLGRNYGRSSGLSVASSKTTDNQIERAVKIWTASFVGAAIDPVSIFVISSLLVLPSVRMTSTTERLQFLPALANFERFVLGSIEEAVTQFGACLETCKIGTHLNVAKSTRSQNSGKPHPILAQFRRHFTHSRKFHRTLMHFPQLCHLLSSNFGDRGQAVAERSTITQTGLPPKQGWPWTARPPPPWTT